MLRPALLTALFLGGCATTATPVEVTRFSLASDVARGTVAAVAGTAPTLEQQRYDAAVAGELGRLGFASGDGTTARYLYSTEVTRETRNGVTRRSPVTIGVGGGTGGYGGGVGLGASFGLGGNRNASRVEMRLAVRLIERATGQIVWEGRADGSAVSRSVAASPSETVDRLAAALFRDFPGPSGRTISVP